MRTPVIDISRFERTLRTCEAAARIGLKLWSAAVAGVVAALFFLTVAAPAFAAPPSGADVRAATAELCRAATDRAERVHQTPPGLLRAVSLVESGRAVDGVRAAWPWTVNLEGAGHWFETRDEALAFVRAALAEGRDSFDVGCMQINYRWHGRHFASVEEMFDPSANADYAARFLSALEDETGDWMRAAGYYHSRTPSRSDHYRGLVAAAYADALEDRRQRRLAVARPAELRPAAPETPPPSPVVERAPVRRASWPNYDAGAPLLPQMSEPIRPRLVAASPPEDGGGLLRPVRPLF